MWIFFLFLNLILNKFFFPKHLEQNKGHIVPENHPVYLRLIRITKRLLNANKDLQSIKDKTWSLTVVDGSSKNAYVLPVLNNFILFFNYVIKFTNVFNYIYY